MSKRKIKIKKKKEVKPDFSVINTETKIFKDGRKLNIVSYSAPDVQVNEIFSLINKKSRLMSESDKFKNASLNLMIKFGSGWRSFKFQNAGSIFEFLLNYDDIDFDYTVSEFKISFIV